MFRFFKKAEQNQQARVSPEAVQQAYESYDPLHDVSGIQNKEADRVPGMFNGRVAVAHAHTVSEAVEVLQHAAKAYDQVKTNTSSYRRGG